MLKGFPGFVCWQSPFPSPAPLKVLTPAGWISPAPRQLFLTRAGQEEPLVRHHKQEEGQGQVCLSSSALHRISIRSLAPTPPFRLRVGPASIREHLPLGSGDTTVGGMRRSGPLQGRTCCPTAGVKLAAHLQPSAPAGSALQCHALPNQPTSPDQGDGY